MYRHLSEEDSRESSTIIIDICSISNILIWSGHAKKCRLNVLSYMHFNIFITCIRHRKRPNRSILIFLTTLKIILAPFYTWNCTNIFINHIMFDSNILIWIAVFITMHSTFLDIIFNRFYDYHYASGNITDFRFMLRHYLLCLNLCDTLDWKNNIKFHFHDFAWKWIQNQWNFLTIIKPLPPLVIFAFYMYY